MESSALPLPGVLMASVSHSVKMSGATQVSSASTASANLSPVIAPQIASAETTKSATLIAVLTSAPSPNALQAQFVLEIVV